jgi:hypothetical protein
MYFCSYSSGSVVLGIDALAAKTIAPWAARRTKVVGLRRLAQPVSWPALLLSALAMVQGACASRQNARMPSAENRMERPSDRGHATPESTRAPAHEDVEAKTLHLLAAASACDFGLASRDFGEVMQHALPPTKFAETWRAVEHQIGGWRAVETIERKSEGELSISLATSRFERGRAIVKVVYDTSNRIVGLFFLPISPAWHAPAYARPDLFEEREVRVGAAPALHGVLTLPKGPRTTPGVVLVHGSGPSDEDESVGALRPFKDLAWGLASRGIAVLRYVKRSRQAPDGILTQKEEVLDAAHDALELLQRTPRIDPRLLFVLGHSQGGELAPRIAEQAPRLAGIIVLGAPTEPVPESSPQITPKISRRKSCSRRISA